MNYRTVLASVLATGLLTSPVLAAGETTAEGAQMEGTSAGGAMDMTQMTQDEEVVRTIQQALQERGYDVETDGVWGESTQQALTEFQQEQGIQAEGEVTPDTLAALEISGEDMPQAAQVPTPTPAPTDQAPASPTQPAQ